ncbi:LysR substrate-binding domain-containing protein [Acidipila sp. EB88]|uniref:LysR substrate-binding domain-containing protein n=1 Tax=Acidipila sp. EB88 TaxID=2305226 RepID=UPI000F5FCFBA|nr:LysR substrate-binding domain-containing protein [Acidipila sp. EB88]RRA49467.1 LysR family transcriptional regulator [Acidipila sp. EB88]
MDQDVELRHLRYFVVVAEELHFGRAAARLHLSQPPLSQQIRRLEEILGYPLFQRTSRSVKLTDAGECLLERARRVLTTMQRDIDETRHVAEGEVGSLHIGFVGSAMLSNLPEIFRTFRETHPRVRLHLYESFTSRVQEGLQNGSLDVGILRDSDVVEQLHTAPLYAEPYVAVLPATHACARQKSLAPAALQGEPFVYYPRSAGARAFEKPLRIFEEHGFRPQIVQEASHWLTILRLVGAGMGVSVAPACVRQITSAEVVCLPLRGTEAASELEVAYAAGDTRPIVQNFARLAGTLQTKTEPAVGRR